MSVIDVTLLILLLAFVVALVRVVIGPTLADRAAAADVCFFCVVSALALLAVRLPSVAFVDAVLVATLLGFVATVSLARLVGKDRSP